PAPATEPTDRPAVHKQTIAVPMRDGIRLATDVYLPSTNGSFPTLLARTPYNKTLAAGLGEEGARRGYATVIQDTRGRFGSEGANLPFDSDVEDGHDTLGWILQQPWCNGKIGTFGGSAGAITQFLLARSGVTNLLSQHFTVGAPSLYFHVVYTGGVFRKALVEDWLRLTQFSPDALQRWLNHPTYDNFWRERELTGHYPKVHAAAVHIGGYFDIFAHGTIDAFVGYQNRGSPRARGRQKLIIGPWTHNVFTEKAGDLTFPNAKRPPNNLRDQWGWFDHTLKAADNGLNRVPPVTYYVMGDTSDPRAPGNLWRTADRWPPLSTQPTPFYLHADRTLSRAKPASAAGPLRFAYDPANPVPTLGGPELTLPAGPKDQRSIETRPDVLVFTSEPLAEPLEITGHVRAKLWIASDAPDTDFFMRLCDVYPDGRSFNICEGRLRARFRESFRREKFLRPGDVCALDLDLWATSIIFNKGHRLRVHVTSSSAPGFDPNPNTGEPLRRHTATRVAQNTIYCDAARPSHVLLPLVAGQRH
ncbi:MAG: CocE/NonD family hydrolase, partial [Verrucomicrobiae bacterium]|nr:CocE/NonD family hydrolase [Verrucomicrobiae bacterium]